ncbi:hypothetical protein CWO23_21105, partial [Vibrio splendidus]
FCHFNSPLGWRVDLILRAERLECGVHDTLTILQNVWGRSKTEPSMILTAPIWCNSLNWCN